MVGDLLFVLPTGFGKSLIFQPLVKINEIINKRKQYAIIFLYVLESIIGDQIEEALVERL
jgi:superfamily II DNA helicase RecQ